MSDNLPRLVVARSVGWDELPATGGFVLPTGTVTLLLGDVEGSTRAWEDDPKSTEVAIVELNELVDELVGRFDGVRPVEQGEGDSFVAAFARARDAIGCALAIQRALVGAALRVRLGVHTGEVVRRDEGNYVGPAIIRTARLRNLAHGGQTVLSETARDLALDALPDGCALRDLGVHRLKDLSRPERVFQLTHPDLPETFPPLRSLDARRHNLPVQRTTFIGRSTEIAQLSALLTEERLVTLTGSGGCGKTRLALQVAAEAFDSFADGVWFADLAPVVDADGVAAQVAQVFAVKEAPGATLTEAVVAYLSERRALLIVDNCEHLLDAAAELVDTVLEGCAVVTVLATSRQALGLEGEVAWRVPSLPVPADDRPAGIAAVSMSEAVRLFADRARRASPTFALSDRNAEAVAEICRRLDGIPLALELAAARVRVFTAAQIADALSERFAVLTGAPRTALPRQQTLEASVDWSHALLTEIEQTVFRRLAVFHGGFTFEAARDVCGSVEVAPHQVLDVLSLLVDKSLVDVTVDTDEARYNLLETVRAYAAARLAASGEEAAIRDRHGDHYLHVAEEAEPRFESAEEAAWVARTARDYPNVRAALAWSRDRGHEDHVGRLAASLVNFWWSHGPVDDGKRWLDAALNRDGTSRPLRVRLLLGRAWLAMAEWDAATLMTCAEEGIALASAAGDERLVVRCRILIGSLTGLMGGPTEVLEAAIAQARDQDDGWALAIGLNWLGARVSYHDPGRACALYREAAEVGARSNPLVAHHALGNLGGALAQLGDFGDAIPVLHEALARAQDARDLAPVGGAQCFLAIALLQCDRRDDARQVIDDLDVTARELGIPMWSAWAESFHGWLAFCDGDVQRGVDLLRHAVSSAVVPIQRVAILAFLAEAEVVACPAEEARPRCAEVLEAALASGYDYVAALAHLLTARLHRGERSWSEAERAAHAGLTLAVRMGNQPYIIEALEVLAALAADREDDAPATRLFAAASAARDMTGYAHSSFGREAEIEALRTRSDAFDGAWTEGSALTLDAAIAYVRRGQGERKRPTIGWEALTPAELHLVELVREGCTNAEIGGRMFVSTRTVQAHLTRIFTKLAVKSRTELASVAAEHRPGVR
jgi:predicted ATPase/class 3 adenylate cyclase/DNA-binding NarL/FixJ family response regulator